MTSGLIAHNPEVGGSSPPSATRKQQSPIGWLLFLLRWRFLLFALRVMSPTGGRGGRIPGGDVCERRRGRMQRAIRSGRGRNSATRNASKEFRAPQQGAGSSPPSATRRKALESHDSKAFFALNQYFYVVVSIAIYSDLFRSIWASNGRQMENLSKTPSSTRRHGDVLMA